MAWRIAPQMIAECPRAARSGLEVMYAGGGFKIDAIMVLAQAIGKLGLKTIADTHEILVEAPDSKSELAPNREIATHELTYPGSPALPKVKAGLRKNLTPCPWLDDATSDEADAIPLKRRKMCGDEPWLRYDIIIEEENILAICGDKAPVHRFGHRGYGQPGPPNLALALPSGKGVLDVLFVLRCLVEYQDLGRGRF